MRKSNNLNGRKTITKAKFDRVKRNPKAVPVMVVSLVQIVPCSKLKANGYYLDGFVYTKDLDATDNIIYKRLAVVLAAHLVVDHRYHNSPWGLNKKEEILARHREISKAANTVLGID